MEGGEPIELHASSWVVDAVWDGVHDSAEDQDGGALDITREAGHRGLRVEGFRKSDSS